MPFIKPEKRPEIDKKGLSAAKAVGDICYYYYKSMVEKWKKEPRWTTAHNIYKEMARKIVEGELPDEDNEIAYGMAYDVFFQLYVMPYELKNRKLNGDI